ncbi:MAG TPA: alpha/beta hydrolase [Bacteroidales bacterium]|nr:alpha/beta hydrolase [Bacteroidales bacterium]
MSKISFFSLLLGLALIAGISGAYGQVVMPKVSGKPYENSHFLKIDSATFHYRIYNEGIKNQKGKVLLVHGFCGSTFCWRKNIDALVNAGYLVVAIDLPGFGYSDRNLRVNQSHSGRAHLIWALLGKIDQDDKRKWNIVGHSMGGGAVEAMALMNADRVQTVTLVDGMVFIRNQNMEGTFITMSKMKGTNQILVSLAKHNIISYNSMERLMKKVYGRPLDSVEMKGYIDPLRIKGSAASVINIYANAHEIRHLHADGLLDLPVLVIWGKKDRTIYLRNAKKLKRNVPTIDLKIIPDAHHAAMETHPQQFNELLLDFLNAHN